MEKKDKRRTRICKRNEAIRSYYSARMREGDSPAMAQAKTAEKYYLSPRTIGEILNGRD